MKKGLTIGKTRSALYKSAKFLGDVNSVKRGSVGQRLLTGWLGTLAAKYQTAFRVTL